MPEIVNFDQRKRRLPPRPHGLRSSVGRLIRALECPAAEARNALQEAIFALQVTHARTSIVIGDIEDTESRETLRAQSARISTLIDLA